MYFTFNLLMSTICVNIAILKFIATAAIIKNYGLK